MLSEQYSQKGFVVDFRGTEGPPELFDHFAGVRSLGFLQFYCLPQSNDKMFLVVVELGFLSQCGFWTESICVLIYFDRVILSGFINGMLWIIRVKHSFSQKLFDILVLTLRGLVLLVVLSLNIVIGDELILGGKITWKHCKLDC